MTKTNCSSYQKLWRDIVKQKALIYVGGERPTCASCGATESLQFDHINSELKLFTIGHALGDRGFSWDLLASELDKCQLLCSSCHSKKTAALNRKDLPHGHRGRYQQGCRCNLCREAFSAYERWRRLGTGETRHTYNHPRAHGTRSCFTGGCRCDECVMANRAYLTEYRNKNKGKLRDYHQGWNRKKKGV